MAVTSSFAGPLPFIRRHPVLGVVHSLPTASAFATTSKILVRKLSSPSLLSLPLSPNCLRRCQSSAADTYYDDHGEASDAGSDDERGEGRRVPAAAGTGGTRAEEAGRRLYVGNLPYSMTPSQLAEVFSEAGTVASVEMVYDRLTDRSRGFAFVTMGSTDDARSAIRMFDGTQVGGRTVKVNFPEVPRGGEREVMGPRIRDGRRGFVDSPHKLYAGNLSWTVTSDSLRDAFAGCPGLLAARVVYERDTGRSKGYGFVSFASAEDAQSALDAMDGAEVEGRSLRLNNALNSIGDTPAGATNSGIGGGGSFQVLEAAAGVVESAASIGP
ncbi:hypothetical protein Taro_052307 [Colocasia esculenta]|uniref:RRM domain-containing protein n=1 Tax=Colocasia esculenta TaxID=4460 RepID=A0A843XIZ7_COLES|nr:hypothetical protein [Colocasia esculenta]